MKARIRIRLMCWLGLALGVTALAAPVGQAATRPDNRAGTLGVGTHQLAADNSDVISRYLGNRVAPALRPDDRAGILGAGVPQVAADSSDVISRYLGSHAAAALRPDDRGGIRGVGAGAAGNVTPAPDQAGSFWGVTELAAGSALGALAASLVGFALIRHRRSAIAALQS